ncbi:MAG: tRNA pseudouridine(38-40) synthase TruA [Clostridiales bacterium]|nr:tRNA pseudouridine(38-40) synthase TruA [Clostridiales bacterium]MCF8022415.1 tRNA pseudouridine(38-40) synthase TruA [Clostridiales bacterium]
MRKIKLTIAYDGTSYHGFQEQRVWGIPTIQEVLEKTLIEISNTIIKVHCAGRTDAGVHARGQVVSFDCSQWPVPTENIVRALNGALPGDIVALKAEDVSPDFHARISAVGKTYLYVIFNDNVPSPFYARYSYFFPRYLDAGTMQKAAFYLEGTHDFRAFKSANSPLKNTTRTIYDCKVKRRHNKVYFCFRGNGFLYNMVRILTGTLLKVGIHKFYPEDIPDIINSKDRSLAGPTVPACGLFLEKVHYNV